MTDEEKLEMYENIFGKRKKNPDTVVLRLTPEDTESVLDACLVIKSYKLETVNTIIQKILDKMDKENITDPYELITNEFKRRNIHYMLFQKETDPVGW